MPGEKWRMRCLGRQIWTDGKLTGSVPGCGWTGVRTAGVFDCECYPEWKLYCRPLTPGPGCPAGIVWPCPRCKGAVTGTPVKRRVRLGGEAS